MGTRSIAVIRAGFLGSELATANVVKGGYQSSVIEAGFLGSGLATLKVGTKAL